MNAGPADMGGNLSESELWTAFHGISDAIFLLDQKGSALDVNQGAAETYGYPRDQLREAPLELTSAGTEPYTQEQARKRVQRAADGDEQTFEWLAQRKNGETFWEEVRLTPVSVEGDPRVLAVAREIDQRKQREEKLERIHMAIQIILRADSWEDVAKRLVTEVTDMHDIPCVSVHRKQAGSQSLEPVACSEAIETAMGTPPTLGPESLAWEAFEADKTRYFEDLFEHDDQIRGDSNIQSEVIAPIGSEGVLIVASSDRAAFSSAERLFIDLLTDTASAIIDVIETKHELQDREEKYRTLFEESRDALMLLDDEGFFDCNETCLDLFGVDSVESFVELTPWELSPEYQPDGTPSREAASEYIEEAFDTGSAFFEWTHQTADGEDFEASVKLSRFEHEGEPAIQALVRDVSQRKEREQELQESQERLRALFEESPDTIVVHDESGNIREVNERAVEQLGYSRDELLAMNVVDFDVNLDHEEATELWGTMGVGETEQFEGRHRRKDGTTFPSEIWLRKINVGGHKQFIALGRDITERKEREVHLEKAQEVADIGWWRKDIPSDKIHWSDRVYELWGAKGVSGPIDHETFESYIHPDDLKRVNEAWQAALGGDSYEIEHRIITDDGEVRWMQQKAELAYNNRGEPVHALGVVQDITEQKEHEQEVKAEREFLEDVIESLPFPFYVLDVEDYTVELANAKATVSEGDTCHEITHRREEPCDKGENPIDCPISTVCETGDSHVVEHVHYHDGEERIYQVHGSPITDEAGDVVMMAESNIDITGRVKREQELEKTRERLEMALEAADAGVWRMDIDSEELSWDDKSKELWGYGPDEFEGTFDEFMSRVHPDDWPALEAAYTEAITDRSGYEIEFRVRPDDGSVRWVQAHATVMTDDDGSPTELVGIARDITSRKDRQRELEEYESIVESADDILWMFDANFEEVRFMNDMYEEMWGQSIETLETEPTAFLENVHKEDINEIVDAIERLQTGEAVDFEVRVKPDPDTERWMWIKGHPVYDTGEHVANTGFVRDITHIKEREQELRKYETMVDHAGYPVVLTDENEVIEYVNPAFIDTTGYEEGTALGNTPRILKSGEHSADFYRDMWTTLEDDEVFTGEIVNETADGERFVAEVAIAPVENEQGKTINYVGIYNDITARKEYEQALREAREELRAIIDLVPDPIFVKDESGEYLLANERIADIYGQETENIEGKTDAHLAHTQEHAESCRAEDKQVLETGEKLVIDENEVTNHNGETRIFQTTKVSFDTPRTDQDAVLGYSRDVTELKEYEAQLKQQRDNLKLLNKVVRHDIRNDLQLIDAYADMLAEEVESEYLDIIKESSENAIELTQTARTLSQVMLDEAGDLVEMDLARTIQSQVTEHEEAFSEATFEVEDLDSVTVEADDMLPAIFRNLLKNAVIHNDSDQPVVEVGMDQFDDHVRVTIADNGPGIPDDQKQEIFGEGNKGLDSEGTGIGLYLVQKLVERYGGEVSVEDNDPEGSVFTVELPRHQ